MDDLRRELRAIGRARVRAEERGRRVVARARLKALAAMEAGMEPDEISALTGYSVRTVERWSERTERAAERGRLGELLARWQALVFGPREDQGA